MKRTQKKLLLLPPKTLSYSPVLPSHSLYVCSFSLPVWFCHCKWKFSDFSLINFPLYSSKAFSKHKLKKQCYVYALYSLGIQCISEEFKTKIIINMHKLRRIHSYFITICVFSLLPLCVSVCTCVRCATAPTQLISKCVVQIQFESEFISTACNIFSFQSVVLALLLVFNGEKNDRNWIITIIWH